MSALDHSARDLDRDECLDLLGTASVGRVSVSVGALPAVLPVNFCLSGDAVIFRTAAGTKLSAACTHAVVAFEADDIDPIYHAGWSVLVRGIAEEVTDPEQLGHLRRLPLAPWAAGDKDHFVRIPTEVVSGRQIGDGWRRPQTGHRAL